MVVPRSDTSTRFFITFPCKTTRSETIEAICMEMINSSAGTFPAVPWIDVGIG
jgi:hypothetical protein